MSARHTPGPWQLHGPKRQDGADDYAITTRDGEIIAEAFGRSAVKCWHPSRANAHLIATAPDLLALAKQFASECGECSGSGVHDVYPNPLPVGVLVSPCGEEPCPDCADTRAVIDRAEGRA